MTAHPYLAGAATPRVLAHRGLVTPSMAEQGVAENTRAAFRAAVDAGAHYLESDCHLTSDGEVVLIHDSHLDRIAGDPRAVAEIPYRELASIMGSRGGLLTLGQLLDEFVDARCNIDIKSADAAEPAAALIAPHTERVLVASFDDRIRLSTLRAIGAHGAAPPATGPGSAAFSAFCSRSPRDRGASSIARSRGAMRFRFRSAKGASGC